MGRPAVRPSVSGCMPAAPDAYPDPRSARGIPDDPETIRKRPGNRPVLDLYTAISLWYNYNRPKGGGSACAHPPRCFGGSEKPLRTEPLWLNGRRGFFMPAHLRTTCTDPAFRITNHHNGLYRPAAASACGATVTPVTPSNLHFA